MMEIRWWGGVATDPHPRVTRRVAIERWLWSEGEGRYGDWDIARGGIRPGVTAATLYPLFTGVIEGGPRADAVAAAVEADVAETEHKVKESLTDTNNRLAKMETEVQNCNTQLPEMKTLLGQIAGKLGVSGA